MLARNRPLLAALLALVLLSVAGARAHAAARAQLTVFAASSLVDAFPQVDAGERYSFGGSNTLAAQIQQGAPADVYAAANTTLPAQLFAQGLCSRPVVFTRNTLVLVVPKSNPAAIHSVFDLSKQGVKLVIAASGVPVGSYTLQVLKQMNLAPAVLQNVVSREIDVREVLAKVALGEADAGFVYSTDARTVPGKVTVIRVPAWAQPKVQYGICVVTSSAHKPAAQAFVAKVLSKSGQAKLIGFGFLPRVKRAPGR